MASLRKHGHGGRTTASAAPTPTIAPDSPSTTRKTRYSSKGGVLSAAIAEHYNRTHPLDSELGSQRDLRDLVSSVERGSDVPWWVSHPVFKGLVVAGLVIGALTPVFLKVGRAESEQRRKRDHNDSFKKENPEVAKLGEYQQNNYYCHAPFPGALDSVVYKRPHGSELRAIQIITRNGDRAPCGVLPFENNVTWNCDGPDLYDPSGMPIEVKRVRDEPDSLRSVLWKGNCWLCDVTGRGIAQQHMLGEALGNIYGELLEMSPSNLYVRSVDSDAIQRSVRGMVRGLLTNAIDGGTVRITAGLNREDDVLLPRLAACPRLAEIWRSMHADPSWESFKEKNQQNMQQLVDIMSPLKSREADDDGKDGDDEGSPNRDALLKERESGDGRMTGAKLPALWEGKFDLFLDTVRARTCNGVALPCSPKHPSRCVSAHQAEQLFTAGDWLFRHKYTFQREETARLFAGPLLALLFQNLGKLTEEKGAQQGKGTVQVYSGEVDTVGSVLAALNVTDWAWPPYASNIVLELWKRTETEALPRVEGGQLEAELFVRMLYNGRVVRPSFCQRDECPLRTYKSHVMQFLLPEDLEEACKIQHIDPRSSTSVTSDDGSSTNLDSGGTSDGNAFGPSHRREDTAG